MTEATGIPAMLSFRGENAGRWLCPRRRDARDSCYHQALELRLACKDLQEQTQSSLISIPGSQAFLEKTN